MKERNLIFDTEAVFNPDDYMHFYAPFLTDERTEREVQFLVRELKLEGSMRILDLACGFGRHANRLAELGHQVTGVDITPAFLEMARQDAARRGVHVEYVQGDMRNITYRQEFDRVLSMFTSFGYFGDDDNFKVLKNVARALKPGGLFCLDTMNRDRLVRQFLPCAVTEKERDLMIERNEFDPVTGRIYNRRIIIRHGRRKDAPFSVRLYTATEMAYLLKEAGFDRWWFYGDWDGSPLTLESRRMIVIARRAQGAAG